VSEHFNAVDIYQLHNHPPKVCKSFNLLALRQANAVDQI